jgi:hypothetical protein
MYPFADAIDDPINDNFRGGAIDTTGSRFSGASSWTADNSPTVTAHGDGRFWLNAPSSATLQLRGYYQPVPSGNWCIRVHLTMREMITTNTQRYVGMYLRDSTSGKEEVWAIGQASGTTVAQIINYQMTNNTTFSATRTSTSLGTTYFPTFLEIEYDGTNYYLRAGFADQPLQKFAAGYAFAKTTFLTAAADGIGVFASNNQSNPVTGIFRGIYRVPTSALL